MHSYALYLFLTIYIIIFPRLIPIITNAAAIATPAYTVKDFILLNCGNSATSNDTSSRSWDGDERSRYAPPNAAAISSASAASYMHPSVFPVPYQMARVFLSPFTYTFPVSAGHKFIRLYFYPDVYSHLNTSRSFFSVTANRFTLLSNFSAFLHSRNASKASFMKEFVINMEGNQKLVLTFSPVADSFAFINRIEIVSIPDTLYFRGEDVPIKFVDQLYFLKNDTALENLYRLNVGGRSVEIQDDSGPDRSMFRAWSNDDDYIYFGDHGSTPHLEEVQIKYTAETPRYSAPEIVYTSGRVMSNYSISLEWGFPVESGFYYLLRLHFCEFTLDVTKQNQRVFTIYINNQTAEIELDVIYQAGGPHVPIFRDYIAWVPDDGRCGKQDLRLSLLPSARSQPKYLSALLNGLEIFKLSDSNRSLAAGNPELIVESLPSIMPPVKKRSRGYSLTYAVTGSVIGVLAVAAMSFMICRRWRKVKDSITTSKSWVVLLSSTPPRSTKSGGSGSSAYLPSHICRSFSVDEIWTATRHFNSNLVVGEGGFGKVYKGLIDDGSTTVAIKRLNPLSNQGIGEFLTEIKMLSKLRHLNLVSLIGYCDEYGEMILVYDYMAHGTLRSHLYGSEYPPLTWNQRLRICLGAAKGLYYLHTSTEHAIIHRDVKTTNILLDEKWVAKMSDFGLSKVGPTGGVQTHVSTAVKGSFGYVDPEYYRRRQLTEKSDVYSFGVVLFEVLCGRPAVVPSLPKEEANLAEWAKFCYKEGKLEQIVDANLNGQITPACFDRFAETAIACVRDKGFERPPMNDVVWSLEFALQLQETAVESTEASIAVDGEVNSIITLSPSVQLHTTDEEMSSRSSQVPGSMSSEFSLTSSTLSDVEIAGKDLNLKCI